MPLTELQIRNAKPAEKPYRLSDGHQLSLLVHPNGSRYWQYMFVEDGKRRTAGLGKYPGLTLKEAREKRDELRKLAASGKSPRPVADDTITFGTVVNEWMQRKLRPESAEATITKTEWLLAFVTDLNPRPITEIKAADVLAQLRRVEAQGRLESARRLRSVCSRIFRYAIACSYAERDVCADLTGALTAPKVKHRAAPLTQDKVAQLLRAVRTNDGHPTVTAAIQLGILTFVRPYELRFATWEEIDEKGALWRIPAGRMKMSRDHIVPLSRQALKVLTWIKEFNQPKGFIFPQVRTDARPISENTVNAGLRRLGFTKDEVTHHGFRRMASTLLNEAGFPPDWIEKQLAHEEGNKVRGAYNAAEYLDGRRKMMQEWADMLDRIERGEEEEDLIG